MYNANAEEQKILDFWDQDKTFEKSVASRPEGKPYVFYDGPPFATGLPHYGHIVASTMKDIVPRYFTMRGFRVERKWGWDCHGLPIENIIEKELNLNSRRDIEKYGVANFNEACRATVLKYAHDWKKTIRRIGRWVDMEHDYKTMDPAFMESVWWVFKQLWERDLIYKGHKPMHICPRCVTPLSNFEVTQGYKDVKDLSATAKFKLKETRYKKQTIGDGDVYILAWTTTPWTLPGNVLLAVGNDIEYVLVTIDNEEGIYVIAKDRLKETIKDKGFSIIKEVKGKNLIGLDYEPLFPYFADTPNAFRVVAADFVTTEDGTGIVHIAPAYGEDDFNLGQQEKLPLVQHVTMEGRFTNKVTDFADVQVKPIDDPTKTDVEIIKWLAHNGKLFSKQKIEHSYPHCWRCDTPLLNYATTSWFVRVTELKEQLLKNNEAINWVPEHIKHGRFGKWLEGARDWAVSRTRYWGTPLPVWEGENGEVICVGSIKELEELTGAAVTDLHKHFVDAVIIAKDGKKYTRVPDVFDCWFESGSMPYGQMHYPFENKAKFEASFPAEFIAEGQDQTRGWFYTLHILATALTMGSKGRKSSALTSEAAIPSCNQSVPAFKNVIVNGIVLAEDGKKMSKRLKNYPEPEIVLEKYGADAMRFYLASSPVMEAESLNFSEAGVREMFSKVVNTLWNVLEFYTMFANKETRNKLSSRQNPDSTGKQESKHILDRWIMAKLHELTQKVTAGLENYKLAEASRPILDFITELSQWYVRRIRDRVKDGSEDDKQSALMTLREVLLTLAKLMAPFTPFIAEKVWATIGNWKWEIGNFESVHLQSWPEYHPQHHAQTVLDEMATARKIVEMGLALRAESKIKVRQPLSTLLMNKDGLSHELLAIIADELNVKAVEFAEYQEVTNGWAEKVEGELSVWLNTAITPELKAEGVVRELVRTINQMRKDAGLTIEDRIIVRFAADNEDLKKLFVKFRDELKKNVLADNIQEAEGLASKPFDIDGVSLWLEIARVE